MQTLPLRADSRRCKAFDMPAYTQEQAVALLQKVDSADGSSVFDHLARVVLRVSRVARQSAHCRSATACMQPG